MKKPILVVMAAGMGSRYGGLKQMDPVGPNGEFIIDYSLYDARRAGFETVVFIIKHEIEAAFRETVGQRVADYMEVRYAFQQVENLPAGYAVPEGRVKPWGTGHAILSAKEVIDAPSPSSTPTTTMASAPSRPSISTWPSGRPAITTWWATS